MPPEGSAPAWSRLPISDPGPSGESPHSRTQPGPGIHWQLESLLGGRNVPYEGGPTRHGCFPNAALRAGWGALARIHRTVRSGRRSRRLCGQWCRRGRHIYGQATGETRFRTSAVARSPLGASAHRGARLGTGEKNAEAGADPPLPGPDAQTLAAHYEALHPAGVTLGTPAPRSIPEGISFACAVCSMIGGGCGWLPFTTHP